MKKTLEASLTAALSRQVASDVQARGRRYFSSGAVRSVRGDEWILEAFVRGSDLYRVSMNREDDTLIVSCTCPYFDDRFTPCKHIWATLLVAEEKGYLLGDKQRPPDRKSTRLNSSHIQKSRMPSSA